MRKRGSQKKSRAYWVATNVNENLFNEIAPKMHISALHVLGYMFLQHCRSGDGVIKFFIIKYGWSQKNCWGTFRNSWPPLFQRKWWLLSLGQKKKNLISEISEFPVPEGIIIWGRPLAWMAPFKRVLQRRACTHPNEAYIILRTSGKCLNRHFP